MGFLTELKRRNVLRVGAAYIVTAWLIVQVAETLFPIYGLSDEAIRWVVNVLAIGLLPVLVLSWVFEWTPEGLKRDSEVGQEAPASLASAKRLDRMLLIVMALALSYFVYDKFVLNSGNGQAPEDASIAVLAFVDMSPEGDQEYFSDGIAEEVLNLLAAIPELRVISRSSAFTFKGKDTPIPEIAKQLDVGYILEGSVRKDGERVRITAQLIDTRRDKHIWSKTWDRTLDDIFAIQDELAAAMVQQLKLSLLGAPPTSIRTDPHLFALYLQANQLKEQRNETANAKARTLVAQVLAADPNYVPALELRVWLDFMLFTSGLISYEEADRRWVEVSEHILSLDPDNGVVLSYQAWQAYEDDRDIELAAKLFEKVIAQTPPDAEALRVAGGFLRRIGKIEQAQEVLNYSVQIDPLKLSALWQVKENYLWGRQLVKAKEVSDRLNIMWGSEPRLHDALLLLLLGKPEEAKAVVASWDLGTDGHPFMMALIWHDLGDEEKSRAELKRFEEQIGANDPRWASQPYAYLNLNDEAFARLDLAMEVEEKEVFSELFSPFYWNLHDDPRWTELRERVGLSEERLDAIRFEVRLPK